MKRCILAIGLLLTVLPAFAQPVQQSGTVTNGHAAMWVTSGVIKDAGTAANGSLTSLGVTNNGGPGVCINSAPISGPYNQICMSAATAGNAKITVQNFGGAAAQGLEFDVNGVTTVLPTGGGSNLVTGTAPFTAGGIPCFTGSAPAIIDCGLKGSAGAITSGLWQGTPVAIAFGGTGSSSASGARTALGLGTMSTQDASAVAITGGAITGLPTPAVSADAATKGYVDATSTGLAIKSPVVLATAAVLPNTPTYANGASGVGATLTAGTNSTLTVDGTVATSGQRVLVQNQASAFQNGVYTLTTPGSGGTAWVLTRATDFDTAAEMLAGSYFLTSSGATNINASFVLSGTVTTVGTTAANFFQFSSAASAGVSSVNSLIGGLTITGAGGISVNAAGTTIALSTSGIVNSVNGQSGALTIPISPTGRLSLTSGVLLPVSDVTGANTIYMVAGDNNWTSIYDGSNFVPRQFTDNATIIIDSTGHLANTNYDAWECWSGAAVVYGMGPSWNTGGGSDTVRGTGAGSTDVTRLQGRYVNANAIIIRNNSVNSSSFTANQCNLRGTVRTASVAGTTSDSQLFRFLSNLYDAQPRSMTVTDPTASWSYTTNAFRQMNANAANQVDTVQTISGRMVSVEVNMGCGSGSTGGLCGVGLGLSSTTVQSLVMRPNYVALANVFTPAVGLYRNQATLGRTYYVPLENGFGITGMVFVGSGWTGLTGWVIN